MRRSIAVAVALAAILPTVASEHAMPDSLFRLLVDSNPSRTLAMLKGHPSLINSRNEWRWTPIHLAAARGELDLVRWLVRHGADVNARGENDFTPLHMARTGPIAKALMDGGANFNLQAVGATPIQYVADMLSDWRRTKHVLMQRSKSGDPEASESVANYKQLILDGSGVVNALRCAGARLDLMTALLLDRRDVALRLIRSGPEASIRQRIDGQSPLHIAANNGDLEVASALLDAGIDVDAEWDSPYASWGPTTPLNQAVSEDEFEMVLFLCRRGANPDVVLEGRRYGFWLPMLPAIENVLREYSSLRKIMWWAKREHLVLDDRWERMVGAPPLRVRQWYERAGAY